MPVSAKSEHKGLMYKEALKEGLDVLRVSSEKFGNSIIAEQANTAFFGRAELTP